MTGEKLKISVLSYFYISFVLEGLQRLSGLFVLELLQSLNVSRQDAVVSFTLSWAVSNIMASFSDSLLGNKISEYVILFGILLTATGAALCILTTNISALIVFWGFIFGSGYGLTAPHLSRRLKNVNSHKLLFLLQVTPSLGVTIMPFVLHMLISYYGLQGSYLIISGIILNYLPLSVAAAYNIELRLPNIKWRVRKRSSEYVVSKQERSKIVSVGNFMNSLEPDFVLKISQNDECRGGRSSDTDNSTFSTKEVFLIGRKRSETQGNDFEMYPRIFPLHTTHSAVAVEIQKYENRKKLFEGSFSNKDIIEYDDEKEESRNNSAQILAKNNFNLRNEILHKVSDSDINEIAAENTESEKKCLENCSRKNNKPGVHNCIESQDEISRKHSNNKNTNSISTDKSCEKKTAHEILTKTGTGNEGNMPALSPETEKSQTGKAPVNENPESSSICLENKLLKIPLNIKVYVEEYTFISDGEYWHENLNNNYEKATEYSYRNHSNSLVPDVHPHTDLTCLNFSKNFLKSSELCNPKLSSIYYISKNYEFDDRRISEEQTNKESEQTKCMETILKMKGIFKFLNKIRLPGCLCVLFISVIFEMNLVTLVTIFADFGNDIENNCSDLKWILVSFGAGGLVGKFCCCKISKTIPEKSHAIGVVLFLLTGLSTAGVLFSTNLNWVASFYGILGALESGITYIIPKFIFEHIDRSICSTLSSVKRFLSGVAIICIPYVIGLSRDELGNYEFLLQTLSCSSILCAFLVYFLQYLSSTSDKRLNASFKDKMEMT